MTIARDRGAAAPEKEIQVCPAIRLHHVIMIELVVASRGRRLRRLPNRSAPLQVIFRYVQMETSTDHVKLDEVAVSDKRERPSCGRFRR